MVTMRRTPFNTDIKVKLTATLKTLLICILCLSQKAKRNSKKMSVYLELKLVSIAYLEL